MNIRTLSCIIFLEREVEHIELNIKSNVLKKLEVVDLVFWPPSYEVQKEGGWFILRDPRLLLFLYILLWVKCKKDCRGIFS